ncbi:MAG: magnesium transporter [FCB group bacterium]|nr:magnesium transporter [FCB group bacterium]
MRKHITENEVGLILETLNRLYRRQAKVSLFKLIQKTHPAVMAEVFRHLSGTVRRDIFQYVLRTEGFQEFVEELDEKLILDLLESFPPAEIERLISNFPPEVIADILDSLPEDLAVLVRRKLAKEDRAEVDAIMQYDEDSAGGIMSTQFMKFSGDLTIADVIEQVQHIDQNMDAPFYIYVINDKDQMIGVLSLRQLLLHPPETLLKEIMQSEFIAVAPETDQEQVATLVSRYNYLAIPVVDSDNKLVGVITVDDVIDVLREEATEDILKMAGVGDDREILLKSSTESVKARFPWLMATWVGGIFSMTIIGFFDNLLTTTVALAAFIPVILGMGGNIGTQTSSIIVRGIATGRVNMAEVSKVIFKEIRVGVMLGAIYGILLGVMAYFRYLNYPASPIWLGTVVGVSIFCAMSFAVAIGAFYPILLNKLNVDPAIASGPFVTTTTDMFGALIYLSVASLLLT